MEVPLSISGRAAAEAHLAAISAEHPEGLTEDVLRRELMQRLMTDPAIAADLAGLKLAVDTRGKSMQTSIAEKLRDAGANVVVIDGTEPDEIQGRKLAERMIVDELGALRDGAHRALAVGLLHSSRYLGKGDCEDIRPMPPPLRASGNRQERRAQERRLRHAAKQATKGARR